MRKLVKPADPKASIPSPAHGRDLPADGYVVEWSAHWAMMERRGEIIVSDAVDEPSAKPGTKPKA